MKFMQKWVDQLGPGVVADQAADWFYDRYQAQAVWLRRFQLAFWFQTMLSVLLLVVIVMLLPLKHYFPVLIKQNMQTGETFVSVPDQRISVNRAQIESDIVDYVISRETYSYVDLNERYQHVAARTNADLVAEYHQSQTQHNQGSWFNRLGQSGLRQVVVESVVFLSGGVENHEKNLAKVDFTTVTHKQGQVQRHYWVATIAWGYMGLPKDKHLQWENWNGFTVTFYRVDQRNTLNREEDHE